MSSSKTKRIAASNRGSIIKVKRQKQRFGIVPDVLLLDHGLSLEARTICAYLVGRPDGWTPVVSELCGSLGITDFSWRRLRRELEVAGILDSKRLTGSGGRFAWEFVADLSRYDG